MSVPLSADMMVGALFFAGQHITDQDAAWDVELAGVLARVGAGFLKVVAAGLPALAGATASPN
jgi:hypothetical protein